MKISPVTEQQHTAQEQRVRAFHSLALVVVYLAIFLDALDVSIVTIALPNIRRDLQLTTTELQWVSGIYLLVYAGFGVCGATEQKNGLGENGKRCIECVHSPFCVHVPELRKLFNHGPRV